MKLIPLAGVQALCRQLAIALTLGLVALTTTAQEYPSKSIRFVVPFPPGSGTDVTARYYAAELSKVAGQAVVIENKPGANGFIAVQSVLSAPADGYTVLIGSTSTLATNTALLRELPYDPVSDLTPLTMLMGSTMIFLVPSTSPHQKLGDLMEDARKRPGALNYASGAASYQLASELFNQLAGVKTNHVPYKGAADAARAVMSGEADFTVVDSTTGMTAIGSGKVRPIAVASEARLGKLPQVPTAVESGLRGFTTYTWAAAAVSSKTPKPVADKLASWLGQIAERQQTREYLDRTAMEVMPTGPEAFRRYQLENIQLWKRVAKNANITPQ